VRYPITYSGLKTYHRRRKKRAQVEDFRFHDYRHDLGTKMLRETGNLKAVQKALNHSNIKTTMRYAHVLDGDLRAAHDRVATSKSRSRRKARKESA
jgi:integrase